jgi:transposase-like protein
MSRPPYPVELRQRAVRMVAKVRPNYESDWAAITAVAQKLGIGTAETLRNWSARPREVAHLAPYKTGNEHCSGQFRMPGRR